MQPMQSSISISSSSSLESHAAPIQVLQHHWLPVQHHSRPAVYAAVYNTQRWPVQPMAWQIPTTAATVPQQAAFPSNTIGSASTLKPLESRSSGFCAITTGMPDAMTGQSSHIDVGQLAAATLLERATQAPTAVLAGPAVWQQQRQHGAVMVAESSPAMLQCAVGCPTAVLAGQWTADPGCTTTSGVEPWTAPQAHVPAVVTPGSAATTWSDCSSNSSRSIQHVLVPQVSLDPPAINSATSGATAVGNMQDLQEPLGNDFSRDSNSTQQLYDAALAPADQQQKQDRKRKQSSRSAAGKKQRMTATRQNSLSLERSGSSVQTPGNDQSLLQQLLKLRARNSANSVPQLLQKPCLERVHSCSQQQLQAPCAAAAQPRACEAMQAGGQPGCSQQQQRMSVVRPQASLDSDDVEDELWNELLAMGAGDCCCRANSSAATARAAGAADVYRQQALDAVEQMTVEDLLSL